MGLVPKKIKMKSMQQDIWFTPEGIEDLLPSQAEKLEVYRQRLLDQLKLFGYQQVLPPIAEFTDSLLTGTGYKLALDTCRFTDNESGRMMGVRADMTPQVARIVSNRIKPKSLARLCYVGEVLKSRNNKAKGSRSPIQVGAELFGHCGIESDIEVVDLMVHCARSLNLPSLQISLGHVDIVQALMDSANFDSQAQTKLVDILKRKALPEYQAWLSEQNMDANMADVFSNLPMLCGDASTVLKQASKTLLGVSKRIDQALQHLSEMCSFIDQVHGISVHLDLIDLRGFQYHTGVIFACYSSQAHTVLIAKGGRYDQVCSAFGEDHPATGFSIDLRNLLDSLPDIEDRVQRTVYAPFSQDYDLYQMIQQLRSDGVRVVRYAQESDKPDQAECLKFIDGQWQINAN
jgi:ATP phosphoribosyltransferase regulatory subunit